MTDFTVPGNRRPDLIDNGSKYVTQRTKAASLLLIILGGTAGAFSPFDVKATPRPDLVDNGVKIVTSWRPSPYITLLSKLPIDVIVGTDNFEGWPPPEPPFIQPQKNYLRTVTDTATLFPYTGFFDIIYPQFRRKPDWQVEPPFLKNQPSRLITNLTINPPPVGDLTTQRAKPQHYFQPADYYFKPANYNWFIPLLPATAPLPPPPPVPGPIPWPQPYTGPLIPGRGGWEIPGGTQAIVVFGNGAFLMTLLTPATATAQATFNVKRIGTLNTSSGRVCIRDNGAGGVVCIVDGPFGYFYVFGPGSTLPLGSFTRITDPAFLGADRVAFIDGWWIFNQPGTQTFYTNFPQYSTTFSGSYFALADSSTSKLVTLFENKELLWLVCEHHTEVWYDSGGQYFGFARLVGTVLQIGCSAKHSIARFSSDGNDGLIWLGKSERGQNVVVMTKGFQALTISTQAISDAIASYTYIADAIGDVYQEDGHEFYQLTFPSAVTPEGIGATWVYDGATQMWHRRASYDPYSNSLNRHRAAFFLNFQNQRLVGDYQNGAVYQLTRSAYTDAGWPILARRRTPHIWDGGARERVFISSLQIEFAPGVGNQAYTGFNPQAYLRISRDGGTTYGSRISTSIGLTGNYRNRAIFRRMGQLRDGVIEVEVIDPVKRDIVGATLKSLANDPGVKGG